MKIKSIVPIILLITLLISLNKFSLAEDPHQIKLKNPIRYIYKYKDSYGLDIGDILEIEQINNKKIKFRMQTIAHRNVCDLSGEANSIPEKERDYVFLYDDCELHLKMSDDKETIVSDDISNRCVKYFCGYSGIIGGVVFKKESTNKRKK